MPGQKIKLTKAELKAQRDALESFRRYLPTLQLKKQQLQAEVRRVQEEVRTRREAERRERDSLAEWVALFSEEAGAADSASQRSDGPSVTPASTAVRTPALSGRAVPGNVRLAALGLDPARLGSARMGAYGVGGWGLGVGGAMLQRSGPDVPDSDGSAATGAVVPDMAPPNISAAPSLAGRVRVAGVRVGEVNLVGVNVPVLETVRFERSEPDWLDGAPWTDTAAQVLERLAGLRVERAVLERQAELLGEELRTTTQRVNLFEKVKIPEARENIRRIQVHLGDELTAAVARAKLAKGKGSEVIEQ